MAALPVLFYSILNHFIQHIYLKTTLTIHLIICAKFTLNHSYFHHMLLIFNLHLVQKMFKILKLYNFIRNISFDYLDIFLISI